MDIILLQDHRHLGQRGEVVSVKPGYARNFLLPTGVALEATAGNKAFFEQQRSKIDAAHSKQLDEAQTIADQIAGVEIIISKRAGERDTLYGSVTPMEIVEALAAKGITLEKRQLDLNTPSLKTVGEHKISVDLHAEVTLELTVTIVPAE